MRLLELAVVFLPLLAIIVLALFGSFGLGFPNHTEAFILESFDLLLFEVPVLLIRRPWALSFLLLLDIAFLFFNIFGSVGPLLAIVVVFVPSLSIVPPLSSVFPRLSVLSLVISVVFPSLRPFLGLFSCVSLLLARLIDRSWFFFGRVVFFCVWLSLNLTRSRRWRGRLLIFDLVSDNYGDFLFGFFVMIISTIDQFCQPTTLLLLYMDIINLFKDWTLSTIDQFCQPTTLLLLYMAIINLFNDWNLINFSSLSTIYQFHQPTALLLLKMVIMNLFNNWNLIKFSSLVDYVFFDYDYLVGVGLACCHFLLQRLLTLFRNKSAQSFLQFDVISCLF